MIVFKKWTQLCVTKSILKWFKSRFYLGYPLLTWRTRNNFLCWNSCNFNFSSICRWRCWSSLRARTYSTVAFRMEPLFCRTSFTRWWYLGQETWILMICHFLKLYLNWLLSSGLLWEDFRILKDWNNHQMRSVKLNNDKC